MKFFKYLPLLTLLGIFVWYFTYYDGTFKRLWISADREAQQLLQENRVQEALNTYENQLSVGAIYYNRGKFKKALEVYDKLGTKEAFYNRGNTLVMLGKYKEAMESYKLALEADNNYTEARENLKIAQARQALLDAAKSKGNKEGTGGRLGADKIVFDNKQNEGEAVQQRGDGVSNAAGSVTWLDRLETSPAKFLEYKFAYQLQHKEGQK